MNCTYYKIIFRLLNQTQFKVKRKIRNLQVMSMKYYYEIEQDALIGHYAIDSILYLNVYVQFDGVLNPY